MNKADVGSGKKMAMPWTQATALGDMRMSLVESMVAGMGARERRGAAALANARCKLFSNLRKILDDVGAHDKGNGNKSRKAITARTRIPKG